MYCFLLTLFVQYWNVEWICEFWDDLLCKWRKNQLLLRGVWFSNACEYFEEIFILFKYVFGSKNYRYFYGLNLFICDYRFLISLYTILVENRPKSKEPLKNPLGKWNFYGDISGGNYSNLLVLCPCCRYKLARWLKRSLYCSRKQRPGLRYSFTRVKKMINERFISLSSGFLSWNLMSDCLHKSIRLADVEWSIFIVMRL